MRSVLTMTLKKPLALTAACFSCMGAALAAPQLSLSDASPVLKVLTSPIQPASAEAAEVRYKGWNKRDVLLTPNERDTAASSLSGASWVCGVGLDRGLVSNISGVVRWVPCVSAVSVCSVKAKLHRRNAGISFNFVPARFWCWEY
jgi:hypothetical protein